MKTKHLQSTKTKVNFSECWKNDINHSIQLTNYYQRISLILLNLMIELWWNKFNLMIAFVLLIFKNDMIV